MTTTDGEDFIDYHCGAGGMMFGFKNPRIEAAILEGIKEGLRDLLKFPKNYKLEAILSLGMIDSHPKAHSIDEIDMSKVHYEKY